MKKLKAVVLVILALFGMVIVLQNTEIVETRILFWSISMPRAVLLLGTSLIGFAVGIIASVFLGSKKEEPQGLAEAKNKFKSKNTL